MATHDSDYVRRQGPSIIFRSERRGGISNDCHLLCQSGQKPPRFLTGPNNYKAVLVVVLFILFRVLFLFYSAVGREGEKQ